MLGSVQKIIGLIAKQHKAVVNRLDRHVIPAPDVFGSFKKKMGHAIPVKDFYETTVCYRTYLRQECRKIHSVAK